MKKYLLLCIILITMFPDCREKPPVLAPKNVVLIIIDGFATAHLTATLHETGKSSVFRKFHSIGLVETWSESGVTDSAAAATAIATGKIVVNKQTGARGRFAGPAPSLTVLAKRAGMSTGLVATSEITHATPAAFTARIRDRKDHALIARDMANSTLDLFFGGGGQYFLGSDFYKAESESEDDTAATGKPNDNYPSIRPLLSKRGFIVLTDPSEIPDHPDGRRFAGLFAKEALPAAGDPGRGQLSSDLSLAAIRLLKTNDRGYFLMIEASQVDWAGHKNDADYLRAELKDTEMLIHNVLSAVDKETLVVVTSDHECCGLSISSMSEGNVQMKFSSQNHTGSVIPLMAKGPGEEHFRGIYHHKDIFNKLFTLLRL